MKNDIVNEKGLTESDLVVIPDECGDSMWDAVLGQEVKACQLNKVERDLAVLFNVIHAVKQPKSNQMAPGDGVKIK